MDIFVLCKSDLPTNLGRPSISHSYKNSKTQFDAKTRLNSLVPLLNLPF